MGKVLKALRRPVLPTVEGWPCSQRLDGLTATRGWLPPRVCSEALLLGAFLISRVLTKYGTVEVTLRKTYLRVLGKGNRNRACGYDPGSQALQTRFRGLMPQPSVLSSGRTNSFKAQVWLRNQPLLDHP